MLVELLFWENEDNFGLCQFSWRNGIADDSMAHKSYQGIPHAR
jgi:hypothetical protein